MNDDTRGLEPQTPAPASDAAAEPSTIQTPASPPLGWRERARGLRGVAAVSVAALLLGGTGGAVLGAVSNDEDSQRGFPGGGRDGQIQRGPGVDGRQGQLPGGRLPGQLPGGRQGGPPGSAPGGGVPPATGPQDDVVPDGGSDSSGDTSGGQTT